MLEQIELFIRINKPILLAKQFCNVKPAVVRQTPGLIATHCHRNRAGSPGPCPASPTPHVLSLPLVCEKKKTNQRIS